MKLGVFNPILGNLPFETMLDTLQGLGVQAIEVATGGYVGDAHCKPAELLADAGALARWRAAIEARGLTVSALSCHGNPLHPDEAVAGPHHAAWQDTVRLAEKLGVQTVVTFSGCPGGGPEDRVPNWVTCAWPTDHARAVEWQWAERVLPYWRREADFAEAHGVRVAIEMHPGFCVYQPQQALRLRAETRANVGVNFDPSHLFWQQIDPVKAIRYLGNTIYHFHAKDTALDPLNVPVKGVLDYEGYDRVAERAWIFRSVGYGHPEADWRDMVSALRTVGYDGALSIEHEDALASRQEGLKKAVEVLRAALLTERPDTPLVDRVSPWPLVPPERPVRAVLVGCGGMSAEWLRAAGRVEGLEMVGLVDIREEAARARQQEFGLGGAEVGTDLETVLDATHPDLVFDCTVPEAHRATALTAFAHGAGVLGEKPLADTLAGAREMVEAARSAGRFHAVIQNRRYEPNIRRVRAFVDAGELGQLTTVNADFYIGAHFGGFRDLMQHVLLLDMAIHTFDAARLISGQDPLRVSCFEWNPAGSWYAHGASAVAVFEMTGGVVFSYRGSWCAEGFPTTWESDWRLIGTRGTLRWDGGAHPRAALVKQTGGFLSEFEERELPPVSPEARVGGHEGLIRDAVRALRTGEVPETASADNIKSLAMVLAAIESAETGAWVEVRG